MKRHHHHSSKGLVPPAGPGCLPRAQPGGMERRGQEALINTNPKKYCCVLNKSGRGFLQDLCPLEMSCSAAPPLWGGHLGKGNGAGGLGGGQMRLIFSLRDGGGGGTILFQARQLPPPSLSPPSSLHPQSDVNITAGTCQAPAPLGLWGGIKQL